MGRPSLLPSAANSGQCKPIAEDGRLVFSSKTVPFRLARTVSEKDKKLKETREETP
jgi:hypothetical protein